jgi:hypothetical protein
MAHHAFPHEPLTARLRSARRQFRRDHPRLTRITRRVRAHGPFTVYALTTLVLMAWMLDKICRIP